MTIAAIKQQITDAFIANETVKQLYGLTDGKTFEEQFSTVSLENILFFIVATAMWLNAQLFDQHKADVLATLKENKAHTPNWYATRAKEFQFGYELVADTDGYDTPELTDEQIEIARVVKFAAATEASDMSVLFIKIATESGETKQPVTDAQLVAFTAYLNRIKDAGVRITVINSIADDLRLTMDIYYNPLILGSDGARVDGTDDTPVQDAIRQYIANLSFNGLYTNQALVDALQVVEGVEIAELREVSSRYGTRENYEAINARATPYAGYFQIANSNLTLNFIANE